MTSFVVLVTANAADVPQPGFADPVLGRWDLTIEGNDGSYPSWLEVRLRTETELMARLVGNYGSVRHANAASYDNEELIVRVPAQYEGLRGDLVFSGSLRGKDLIGFVQLDDATLAWRGARAPSLARDAEPVWDAPVSLVGPDLSGWRLRDERRAGCWSVRDGVLKATEPCVDIISEEAFDDFRLQLEFRYPQGSNSGVYLRGRYEVQIHDSYGRALDSLLLGGVYGFIAPGIDAARPAGEWQTFDIELVGRRVTVVLNGTEIISNEVIPGITGGALDSDEGSPGPLMLQGDHGPIEYRNIVITPAR